MKDGIYFVTFKSNIQDFGTGTVVVKDNTVNGGDFGYSYKGKFSGSSAKLTVEKHDKSVQSVFGNIDSFILELLAKDTVSGFLLEGGIPELAGTKIIIDAKFIGELVT